MERNPNKLGSSKRDAAGEKRGNRVQLKTGIVNG